MPDWMIVYCGPAAVPDDLWTRWNVDLLLIAILAALTIAVARNRSSNTRAGWGAIVLMLVIFVSPLCALSSALFSVRVLHHVLLIATLSDGRRTRDAGIRVAEFVAQDAATAVTGA